MTISAAATEIAYLSNGVTTAFAITFPFDTSADLKVTLTDSSGNISVITTGFSVSGGSGATGTITFSPVLATGYTITIADNPAFTQPTDYTDNDSFPAESHEKALDRVTRIAKRLYQQVKRSIRTADGDPITDLTLGSVDNRKGKYLFFNAVTGAIEYAVSLVTTALSQSIIGQLLNPQTPAEAAAGVTPVSSQYEEGEAFRYMTAAQIADVLAGTLTLDVSGALNSLFSIIGIRGRCHAGNYRCDSALNPCYNGTIEGDGPSKTKFTFSAGITKGMSVTTASATYCTIMRGFRLIGNATANARGIVFGDSGIVSNISVYDVHSTDWTGTSAIGIDYRDLVACRFYSIYTARNRQNERFKTDIVSGAPTTIDQYSMWSELAVNEGTVIEAGASIRFYNPLWQTNGKEGFKIAPPIGGNSAIEIEVIRPWFEGNWGSTTTEYQMVADGSAAGATIRVKTIGGFWSGNGSTARAMKFTGAGVAQLDLDKPQVPNIAGEILIQSGAAGTYRLPPSLAENGTAIVSDTAGLSTNLDNWRIAWVSWTPVYSTNVGDSATSFTSTLTTTIAKHRKKGKSCVVVISCSGTLKAVTPSALKIALPSGVTPAATARYGITTIFNGATQEVGTVHTDVTDGLVINRLSLANWGSGNAIEADFTFEFECSQ